MGIYQGTCVITEIKMPVEMATIVGVTRKILSTFTMVRNGCFSSHMAN